MLAFPVSSLVPLCEKIDMNNECNFYIEIKAPEGLSGIENKLHICTLPLEAWKSGYNSKVILRSKFNEGATIEWDMDSSDTEMMVASGCIYKSVEESRNELETLSVALKQAGFPHSIGLDDETGNKKYDINHLWN